MLPLGRHLTQADADTPEGAASAGLQLPGMPAPHAAGGCDLASAVRTGQPLLDVPGPSGYGDC